MNRGWPTSSDRLEILLAVIVTLLGLLLSMVAFAVGWLLASG